MTKINSETSGSENLSLRAEILRAQILQRARTIGGPSLKRFMAETREFLPAVEPSAPWDGETIALQE